MLKFIIRFVLNLFGISNNNVIEHEKEKPFTTYHLKSLMSASEYRFFMTLKELENKYIVHPQLNLASITRKEGDKKYASELFRNIDFAIFDKDYKNLLLLIELNDESHNSSKRKDRDLKVKKICNEIGVDLMTFYTKYPNEKNYVISRIVTHIEKTSPPL